jgi:hypothetical protein
MKPSVLAGFPEPLAAIAFVNGEETAWEQKDCRAAIDWLSQNNQAILGIDLWLVRDGSISTAISTKSGPAIYVSSCDPLKGETWDDYVRRSAKEAGDLVAAFRWPEDSLEPPRTVYFNLCWADRKWFRTHKENASHTFDQ